MNKDQKEKLNEFSISHKIAVVNDWISDPKHRAVYKSRVSENLTYEELAIKYDYSTNQIANIINECDTAVLLHGMNTFNIPSSIVIFADEAGYLKVSP